MGRMKSLLGDQPGPEPKTPFLPRNEAERCKRRKYLSKQSAINSSFAIELREGKLMAPPEFCYKCRAYHLKSKG